MTQENAYLGDTKSRNANVRFRAEVERKKSAAYGQAEKRNPCCVWIADMDHVNKAQRKGRFRREAAYPVHTCHGMNGI